MTDNTWAREKARELSWSAPAIQIEIIADALLSAKLAGWREGREAAKKAAKGMADDEIDAMPEPAEKVDEITENLQTMATQRARIAELEGEIADRIRESWGLYDTNTSLRAENERLRGQTITYPPEMLPSPDEGDEVEIIIVGGLRHD